MKKKNHKLLTLAVLAGSATTIIHVANKFIAATSQLKEMLDISCRNFYEWRLGDIYYTKKGEGTPILLIHDLLLELLDMNGIVSKRNFQQSIQFIP